MKIVVGEQLLPAKSQHIRMDTARGQIDPKLLSTALGLGQGAGLLCGGERSRLVYCKASERECTIKVCTHRLKAFGALCETGWLHCMTDEAQDASSVLPLILIVSEGVVEPVTLGDGRVNVVDPARRKQMCDFRPGNAVASIAEGFGYRLQLSLCKANHSPFYHLRKKLK
jgi:hypothetical protein